MKKIIVILYAKTMEFTILDGVHHFRAFKQLHPEWTLLDMKENGIVEIQVV